MPSRPPHGRTPRAPPPACQKQGEKHHCAPRPRPTPAVPAPPRGAPSCPSPSPARSGPRRGHCACSNLPGTGRKRRRSYPQHAPLRMREGRRGCAQRPPRPCVAGSAHARGVARRFEPRGSWSRRWRQVPVPGAGAVVMAVGPGPPRGGLCPRAGGLVPPLLGPTERGCLRAAVWLGREGLGTPVPSVSLSASGSQSITEGSAGASGTSRCGELEEEGCGCVGWGGGEGMFVPNIRVEVSSTEELCNGGLAVGKECSCQPVC